METNRKKIKKLLKKQLKGKIKFPRITYNKKDKWRVRGFLWLKDYIYWDDKYETIAKSKVKALLKKDNTDMKPYMPEIYDCDDSAFDVWDAFRRKARKKGLKHHYAFGIIEGDIKIYLGDGTSEKFVHALNFFVDDNKVIWLVEPQADELIPCSVENLTRVYRIMI